MACCHEFRKKVVISQPFDMREFLASVAAVQGKEIKTIPMLLDPDQPCGLLISTDESDTICWPANAPDFLATHTVFHELGHIVLKHGATKSDKDEFSHLAGLDNLLPSLSPKLLSRIFGRTAYASQQELEAELFATFMYAPIASSRHARRRRQWTVRDKIARPKRLQSKGKRTDHNT